MGDCLVCGRWIVFYNSANNKMDLLCNKKEIVMAQYINKAALVAEIDRRIKFFTEESGNSNSDIVIALFGLKSFLDSLEVKEMNLDEEIRSYFKGFGKFPSVGIDDCIDIAKHFFELGLKVAQKGE